MDGRLRQLWKTVSINWHWDEEPALIAYIFSQLSDAYTVYDIGCGGGKLLRALYEADPVKNLVGVELNPHDTRTLFEKNLWSHTPFC